MKHMENRNIKEISKNVYSFFIGLFLCLASLSLGLNSGLVVKVISFPFTYLFGIASYLFYALIFAEGLYLIIKKTIIPFKLNRFTVCSFFIFVGGLALITFFFCDQSEAYLSFVKSEGCVNFFEKYKQVFENINFEDGTNNYFVRDYVNLFTGSQFGGGLIGYILLTIGNSIFSSAKGGLFFSIAFLAVGTLIILIPAIVSLVKNIGKKESKKTVEKTNDNKHRIKNINVIKDAKNVDPNNYHSEVSGAGKNIGDTQEEAISKPKITDDLLSEPLFEEKVLAETKRETTKQDDSGLSAAIFDMDKQFNDHFVQKQEEPISEPKIEDVAPINIDSIEIKDECINEEVHPAFEEEIEIEEPVIPTDSGFENKPIIDMPIETKAIENPAPFVKPEVKTVVPEETKPSTPRPRVNWSPISLEILTQYDNSDSIELNKQKAEERKQLINQAFVDFGVGAEVVDYTIGPSVTRYNIRYNANVSQRAVAGIIDDISIRLRGVNARFESVIEGQATSGLIIPNPEISMVSFKEIVEKLPQNLVKHPLAVGFGKNIQGDVIYADFNEFPHILISGTTGSGKSVFVNSIICTLIMRNSPDDVKLVLVDPKKVEMSRYADMPHLLTPIITEASKVKLVLDKLVEEMNNRYTVFSLKACTNIKEYNEDCEENGGEKMPYIIAVLDEYADLVDTCKEISMPVVALAQKARACGIHLMLCTQRPSTNVVTGIIKANLPTHVALMSSNVQDSITIIGEGGAEELLGKGDMLVQSPLVSRVGVTRLQSCFIDRKEIMAIVKELKSKYETYYDEKFLNLEAKKTASEATTEYQDSGDDDEETRYQGIKDWVMAQEYMSMSKIQRECAVGFNRAGRFFSRLQKEGIVALEADSNKGCRVLVKDKFGDSSASEFTSEDNSYIK